MNSSLTTSWTTSHRPWVEDEEVSVKVAVPCRDPYLAAEIDPRFGRALFFIVVDTETTDYLVLDNRWTTLAPEGAGTRAVDRLVAMGIEVVLTNRIGPRAFAALQARDITVYATTATSVRDAVEQFQRGRLSPLVEPNTEEHSE